MRDLGDLGFGMPSAVDINELGQAVFTVVVGGDRFYLWDGSGLWEIQGVRGLGINDRGQVAATAPTLMQSYVWDGTLVELPLSRALDINNAGCQPALNIDPPSASNIDPPLWVILALRFWSLSSSYRCLFL